MARIVDLDDLDEDADAAATAAAPIPRGGDEVASIGDDDRPNPNLSTPFSRALTCYPIVSQLASYVDLNTLHELSRTCRQFRANLLQHRNQLMRQTLRCVNETADPALRLGSALNDSFERWTAYGRTGQKVGRITSGRVGACARDMVGDCRKCGVILCRNCIVKPPSPYVLKGRFRRLCRTCMKCPLEKLTVVAREHSDHESAGSPIETYARPPCTCEHIVWLCAACSRSQHGADTAYTRGWMWRTRYSALGGLGAGLGEGNEGVECGLGAGCLAAKTVEREMECDAAELAALAAERRKALIGGRELAGSSYTTHEMVGIGGQVKKKVKRTLPVGAVVKEYDDERTLCRNFLKREQDGANRAWCAWCARVVPGKRDGDALTRSSESIASSSSTSESAEERRMGE